VATSAIFFRCGSLRWAHSKYAQTVGERPDLTAIDVRTCARRSDDTGAISSEAPDTAWPGSDSGPFFTFITLDP
jgi:hypothetical protein